MKNFVVLAGFLMAGNAFAENWMALASNEKFNVFLDTDSISIISGDIRQAWFRMDRKGMPASGQDSSARMLDYFNCAERTNATVQIDAMKEPRIEFRKVRPGSIGEENLRVVCEFKLPG